MRAERGSMEPDLIVDVSVLSSDRKWWGWLKFRYVASDLEAEIDRWGFVRDVAFLMSSRGVYRREDGWLDVCPTAT